MDYDKYFSDLQKQQEKMFEMERRLMEEQLQMQQELQMRQSMLMQAQHQMQSDADSTENSSNSEVYFFCPYCGEKVGMEERFCPECGACTPDAEDMQTEDEEEEFSSSEDLPECPVDWDKMQSSTSDMYPEGKVRRHSPG